MEAVCRAALDSFGCPAGEHGPLILNLIPWPETTEVPANVLSRLSGILAIEEAGLPPVLREPGERVPDRGSDDWRYLRARGLTHLRRRLAEECGARVCLGGKESGFEGRYPGILEEALFTLEAGQPLYLVGLLGGASLHLGEAILDRTPPPAEIGAEVYSGTGNGGPPLARLYEDWAKNRLPGGPSAGALDDRTLDLAGAWKRVCDLGSERLARNGLSREENRRLLETRVEGEVFHLVLTGLVRLERRMRT